ncbi:hypothetical protein [Streptomyces sp. NPDC046985]|uniref:hypothetical protein n=1 Tax=Streptomyces sp. NPDC046985 TaxID=3155377 RepID=UPI0033D19831
MTRRPHPWEAQAEATDFGGEKALAAALRTAIEAGVAGIDLLPDGFEITGPDDVSLYRSTRTFLAHGPAALARWLNVPESAVHDAR